MQDRGSHIFFVHPLTKKNAVIFFSVLFYFSFFFLVFFFDIISL